ncbi:DNA alkylation repair protein [Herbiconiux daphne]|uniref:DNA alkylation repair protein n=1 Tax=Herbiconiux daphne TaxID=2970914 RepID=A0ABT2H6A2_9MICO|nr:DNA alkylation repair protein [Herbiconiux daphne]MCS5735481.1 DNA alkylation repair protein [Herbiconiux daphne]
MNERAAGTGPAAGAGTARGDAPVAGAAPAARATAAEVEAALADIADAADAVNLRRFFKTGPGQYGEGDEFIGVRVPASRAVAKRFANRLAPAEIDALLESRVHEHRLVGLFLLIADLDRAVAPRTRDEADERRVVDQYRRAVRRGRVDNWDLVDSSADQILGRWLLLTGAPRDELFALARSDDLWQRRVGVLATFAFIKSGDATTTLEIAPLLLDDPHDLLHKAVGWMLREVGKRVDRALLLGFLDDYAARMPRTMLSYATEHLDAEQRRHYRSLG